MSTKPRIGLIGSDIEYAVYDPIVGKYVPAGILNTTGTKGNPEPMVHGGIEIDCCGLEITPNPAITEEQFATNILGLLRETKAKFSDYNFETKPSLSFPIQDLMTVRHAMVMGCSPDFNAWTGKKNPRPQAEDHTLRSFGGHIHIQHGNRTTIRACDLTLGMLSVQDDKDTERRKLYGKAGAFRPKPYGVEYRVLSNYWCGDESSIRNVFKVVRKAQGLSNAAVNQITEDFGGPDEIQDIINSSRVKDAVRVFEAAILASKF